MSVDFADIVLAALERPSVRHPPDGRRSSPHRVRGRLIALEGFPTLGVQDTREIVYSILSDGQRQQFENLRQVDFSYSVPRTARMRVNAYVQRGAVSAALRVIPSEIKSLEQLGMPPVGPRDGLAAARHRPRHRPDRLWQIDDPGRR